MRGRNNVATWALERVRAAPRRPVLWVVFGGHEIAMWDLLGPDEEPKIAREMWTNCGSIDQASDAHTVVTAINAARRS